MLLQKGHSREFSALETATVRKNITQHAAPLYLETAIEGQQRSTGTPLQCTRQSVFGRRQPWYAKDAIMK